jgi:hypothetical protein
MFGEKIGKIEDLLGDLDADFINYGLTFELIGVTGADLSLPNAREDLGDIGIEFEPFEYFPFTSIAPSPATGETML